MRRLAATLALISAVFAASPAWAVDAPHGLLRDVGSPMGPWLETALQCRTVTTWRSSGDGCSATVRRGDRAYFHAGVGFLRAPPFERYVRYTPPKTSSTQPDISTTSDTFKQSPGAAIVETARPTSYFLEIGPGVAFWPTRQLQLNLELGGYLGVVAMQASQALPTSDYEGLALGAFGGGGISYRLPSRPIAFGFNYRVQMIPYGGIAGGERNIENDVFVGHPVVGFGHSFGVSLIIRTEDDRAN